VVLEAQLMTKALTTFLVAVVLVPKIPAATIFVNGLGIPGGTGDVFGTSVNNGRLGFFPISTSMASATSGGLCPTAAPVAAH
jgi:hypothetical protein